MNFQVFFFIEDFFLPSTKLISSITCHRTAVEKAGFKGNRNKKDKRQKTRAVSPNKNTKAIVVLGRSETENTMVRKYRHFLMQRSYSDSCFCLEPINLTKNAILQLFMTIMIMIGSKNSKKLQHSRLVSQDSEY